MIFSGTSLKKAFVFESERIEGERGFFSRTRRWEEFETDGLQPEADAL